MRHHDSNGLIAKLEMRDTDVADIYSCRIGENHNLVQVYEGKLILYCEELLLLYNKSGFE